jgi:hypothetical protein
MPEKVFISHASEDKERFVNGFATRLRERGIDAWLDKWEMGPGDPLVDKIFEEGIRPCNAFIIVLSAVSVTKRWVREELNAAFVKRIAENCKIIPILIEECDIPECLKSTLWVKIDLAGSYEAGFEAVVQSILAITTKPPLAAPPKYARTVCDIVPGLNSIDSIVLDLACREKLESGHVQLIADRVFERANAVDIPRELFNESLDILKQEGRITGVSLTGRTIAFFRITEFAFDQFLRSKLDDYEAIVRSIGLAILNKCLRGSQEIADATGQPKVLINHLLSQMANQHLFRVYRSGMDIVVSHLSPMLKRTFGD